VAARPLESPWEGPVTYPGDTKILVKSSKVRKEETEYDNKARSDGQRFGKVN